ncbi:MAG TPA: hypothetical protein VNI61_06455 [Gemmatimonadales bacterium]|nr:hypothetical protein [Gemmatimonadales bacterium]
MSRRHRARYWPAPLWWRGVIGRLGRAALRQARRRIYHPPARLTPRLSV